MSQDLTTSRRNFLKSGAIVAAPIAAVALPAAALAEDGARARLSRLEDERTIGELHAGLLQRLNLGETGELGHGIARIALDPAAPGTVKFSPDGKQATGRHACTVETKHAISGEHTFERMARLQGNAAASHSASRTLVTRYARTDTGWRIESVALA